MDSLYYTVLLAVARNSKVLRQLYYYGYFFYTGFRAIFVDSDWLVVRYTCETYRSRKGSDYLVNGLGYPRIGINYFLVERIRRGMGSLMRKSVGKISTL